MIREKLIAAEVGAGRGLRWRSREVSRLEGLADAVFGFAITLLVVSLEVPQTFDQLLAASRGFPAFAISFAMLLLVWYQHYAFFRRYGLEDTPTMLLNAALLFVVLFYVYPLKFLWSTLVAAFTGHGVLVHLPNGETVPALRDGQWGQLMLIFDAGYVAVFLVFTLLYLHAYRQRERLGLNRLELFDTWTEVQSNLINVGIGLLSAAIALPTLRSGNASYSGLVYMLIGPALTVHGFARGAQRRRKYEGRVDDGEKEAETES